MDSESARRAAELWHLIGAEPRRVAFLLTGSAGAAETIARRLYWRCALTFRDRRDQYQLEGWLRNAVVRACARRDRAAEIKRFFRRRRNPPQQIEGLTHHQALLWSSLHDLGFRVRAAAVLIVGAGLAIPAAADALGASVGGIESLWARAHRALGDSAASGGPDPIDDLRATLEAASGVPPADPPNLETLAARLRAARTLGVLLLALLIAVACVGAVYAAARLPRGEFPPPRQENSTNRLRGVPASIEGLDYEGAPNWCPSIKGSLPLRREDEIDATSVAFRTNVALLKGYEDSLAQFIERPLGAPVPLRWPTTVQASGLRIRQSGPGAASDALVDRCGALVALRSWTVVLEDPGPPYGDGVAFYMLRREGGLKVWGISSGVPR